MDLLKNEILPLVEQAAESMELDAGLIARVLQPARELDQATFPFPVFPLPKPSAWHLQPSPNNSLHQYQPTLR